MANYVGNKVVLPKSVYEKYFLDERTDFYSLDRLVDIETASANDYYVYPDKRPLEDLGETVELYFDTCWRYPIEAILTLFKRASQKEKIVWYCCEENLVYVSRFTWRYSSVQEDILYLEGNKGFNKLLDDDTIDGDILGAHPFIWYYHPEKRHGWQWIYSEDLLARYQRRQAMDAIDEVERERIHWANIEDRREEKIRFCIECYVRSEDYTKAAYPWCSTSWEVLHDGKWHVVHRAEELEHEEIDRIRDKLNDLIAGEVKGEESLFFTEPFLYLKLKGGAEPECTIVLVADYVKSTKEDIEVRMTGKELRRFTRYLNKMTAKTQRRNKTLEMYIR